MSSERLLAGFYCFIATIGGVSAHSKGDAISSAQLAGDFRLQEGELTNSGDVEESVVLDVALDYNRRIDTSDVVLSPKHYRALKASEAYRQRVQLGLLTPKERDVSNFNLMIKGPKEIHGYKDWLEPLNVGDVYLVIWYPRYQPDEEVLTDTPPRVGRPAYYAVRKSDYLVVKAKLGYMP